MRRYKEKYIILDNNIAKRKSAIIELFTLPLAEQATMGNKNSIAYNHVANADAFENMKHTPFNPVVVKSYEGYKKTLYKQWSFLRKQITFEAWQYSKGDNAYMNSKEMRDDISQNKHLWVFTTNLSDPKLLPNHPMREELDSGVGGLTTFNDIFRGTHDVMGHWISDSSFSLMGEMTAWIAHRKTFSRSSHLALWCETRGQAAWTNTYKNHSLMSAKDRPFAEQKTGIPENWANFV